jgi:hypothetical protein
MACGARRQRIAAAHVVVARAAVIVDGMCPHRFRAFAASPERPLRRACRFRFTDLFSGGGLLAYSVRSMRVPAWRTNCMTAASGLYQDLRNHDTTKTGVPMKGAKLFALSFVLVGLAMVGCADKASTKSETTVSTPGGTTTTTTEKEVEKSGENPPPAN